MKCLSIVRFCQIAITIAWHAAMFDGPIAADDWPMLGRDGTRNSVSTESGAPMEWAVELREGDRLIRESRGIRWSAPLGSETLSSPVVSDGLVWIGTNNQQPGVEKSKELHSVLKCFRVADGKLVYEYISPRRGTRIQDAGWTGLGSSPLIEGDRLWLTTNRSEVLCWDIGPLIRGQGNPRELWNLDLIATFDTFPHVPLMGPSQPCSIGASWNGRIFVTTNNGVGEDRTTVPRPDAANLVCLNKETGEVYWKDGSPSANILMTQLSSPTVTEICGEPQVIVPQSDGWVRSFDPMTGKKLWEFDINAKEAVYSLGHGERSFLVGNAVVFENRVYIASGMDVEHGEGLGRLVCIDPTKRGDVSSELAVDANGTILLQRRVQSVDVKAGEKAIPNPNSALVWEFIRCGEEFEDQMHRTMGSVAIARGLLIVSDLSGMVHCLDARTGQRHWIYNTFASIWASPLIVDDKAYVADSDGDVAIFGLSADPALAFRKKGVEILPLAEIAMDNSIDSSPVFSKGVLYIARKNTLFAIDGDKDSLDPEWTAGNWPQWRGPNRDNVSSEESLLKEWPEGGPPLIWRVNGIGDGVAPISIGDGRMFVTGLYEATEFVRALNEDTGELLWSAMLGVALPQHPLMRWLTQRSPTLDGDRLYAVSLQGELVCLQARDGQELWRKNYLTDFAGKHAQVGYSDCPLVDGDKLICRPGGPNASIVALDKRTGAVLWKCAVAEGGSASYSNGVLTTIAGQRQFVVFLEGALVGISVDDGRLLWRHDCSPNASYYQVHTPFVRDGFVTCISGRPGAIVRLKVTCDNDLFSVNEVYRQERANFSIYNDDTILLGDRLYEFSNGISSCFDVNTGDEIWRKRLEVSPFGPNAARKPGSGLVPGFGSPFMSNVVATTYADKRFYLHRDDGRMSLWEAGLTEPVLNGEFTLPDHNGSSGSTRPVVTGGRLYVREDDQLFCLDVRENTPLRKTSPPTIELDKPAPLEPSRDATSEMKSRTLRSIFVPTPQNVVEKMLELAAVKKTDVIYDLGSGDGRIVITAAQKYGCRAIGYELDPELVERSRTMAEAGGVKSLVTIEASDLFTADLRETDVLAVYLLPQQLEKLLPQLEKMKPGSRLVSHQFEIPGVPADKVESAESPEDGAKHTLYLWTLPLKKTRE